MTESNTDADADTGSVAGSGYAAKPWISLLSEAQRAPVSPAETLVHAFRASVARAPEHPALAYFDGRLSYRETDALSDSVAGHLAAKGLERGDRVAIMLQNSPQFVLALLGAWKAGATVVPLNPMYKSGEVGHVLKDAEVTALICADRAWESYLRDTAAAAPTVRIAVTACELDLQSQNDDRVLNFERLPTPEDADDLVAVARRGLAAPGDRELTAADVALISYTSGTSGTPKGAMNSHGNIMVNAERQRTGHPVAEGSSYFALAPLFHITGMVCQLAACLTNAGTLVLAYRFHPGVVLDAFAEHRPAYTVGPSTAFMALAAHPDVTREHFASFQVISSGGAPLPPALVEKFRAGFGPYIRNGYGLTECTAPCASVPPEREAPSTRSPGRSPSAYPARTRSSGSSTRTARKCRSANRARSPSAVPRSSPATGGCPTPPPPPSRTVSCGRATSASWTATAGCTSSTARRT